MTRTTLSLSLAMALMMSAAVPATAADWNHGAGGIKDYRGGEVIPVPAPVPIPDYEPQWYLRADYGYQFKTDADVQGENVEVRSGDDLNGQSVFSFGFGRYLTNSWRWEMTGEIRPHQKIVGRSETKTESIRERADIDSFYIDPESGRPISYTTDATWEHEFLVNRYEKAELGSYMVMTNMFYDLPGWRGFRPYVGGGLGVVIHSLNRTSQDQANCVDTDARWLDPFGDFQTTEFDGTGDACELQGLERDGEQTDLTQRTTGVGLGLALMTGFGYEVRDGLHWDVGYRYVYQDGTVALTQPMFNGQSVVRLEGRHDHEIRTGIRFDIQ